MTARYETIIEKSLQAGQGFALIFASFLGTCGGGVKKVVFKIRMGAGCYLYSQPARAANCMGGYSFRQSGDCPPART